MIAVKFIQTYDPYEPGHVVDLDDKLANKLITDGIARAYSAPVLTPFITTSEEPTLG